MQIKKTVSDYKNEFKQIRKYVTFKIDLRKKIISKREKWLISHYFDSYRFLTSRPHEIKRFRSKSKLMAAQSTAGHTKGTPLFKVAFVPINYNSRNKSTEFKTRKNKLKEKGKKRRKYKDFDFFVQHYGQVNKYIINIDPEALVFDTEEYLKSVLESFPEIDTFSFATSTGEQLGSAIPRRSFVQSFMEFVFKYEKDFSIDVVLVKFIGYSSPRESLSIATQARYVIEREKAKKERERRYKRERKRKSRERNKNAVDNLLNEYIEELEERGIKPTSEEIKKQRKKIAQILKKGF